MEVEADALVTLGCARVSLGDPAGVEDLEHASELVHQRGRIGFRALINLGWAYSVIGDLPQALRVSEQTATRATQEGEVQGAWFAKGNIADTLYALGRWDEALDIIDSFDAAPEGARYQLSSVRTVRACVLAARDQLGAALEEVREVVASTRPAMDPQALRAPLVVLSRLAHRQGLYEEAEATLNEVAGSIVDSDSAGDPQEWHIELVLALVDTGRVDVAREIVERLPDGVWLDACRATLDARYVDVADLLETTGGQSLQAELRLRAARELVAAGRLDEASRQLERARVFWKSVGATAFLRDTDQLIAAAS
jgi:tetratricopeptide (TPR) repeat protein